MGKSASLQGVAFFKTGDGYEMAKIMNDGSQEPVAEGDVIKAVHWLRSQGWQPKGYWINDAPALGWARSPADFRQAWGEPVLMAPCRWKSGWGARAQDGTAYVDGLPKIGGIGYIFPTRSRRRLHELRSQFSFYQGDLLFVPVEILAQAEKVAMARSARRQGRISAWANGRGQQHQLVTADFRVTGGW